MLNKKLVLLVSLFLLVGVVLVSASMNVLNENSEAKQYVVEIQVTKGWNLIASGFTFASDLNYLDESWDIKKDNIKAVYVYADKINDYISSYPNYDERLYSASDYFKGDEKEIIGKSNWIYVDKSGILKYKTKAIKTIDKTKLYSGWNFVSITSEYLGKELNDIKGTCNLEKVWAWEGEHQQWVNLIDDPGFYSGSEGVGMIIKVTNDCEFETSSGSVTAPPVLPSGDLNENSCTDSDGGKNYNLKGYVDVTIVKTYENGSQASGNSRYEDICMKNKIIDLQDSKDIYEYVCENYTDGSPWSFNTNIYTCPNGCQDGACIN